MNMRYFFLKVAVVMELVCSGVVATDRQIDGEKRSSATIDEAQQNRNAPSQTSSMSPASPAKGNQTPKIAPQPTGSDTTFHPNAATTLAGEQVKWQILSGGAALGTSTNYVISATGGQTSIGAGTSNNYVLNRGFWQSFSSTGGGCCVSFSSDGRTGNVDGDPGKGVDISDLSALIDYLYISFTPPQCIQSANIDGDNQGGVDISDLSGLIDYLYISFTPPALCQ